MELHTRTEQKIYDGSELVAVAIRERNELTLIVYTKDYKRFENICALFKAYKYSIYDINYFPNHTTTFTDNNIIVKVKFQDLL